MAASVRTRTATRFAPRQCVTHGRGYDAIFGWVQLVRSSDNESAGEFFEPDPFALFGDAHSPYCWYGTEPTLFDAPSRMERVPMAWLAYSFLATTPIDEMLEGNHATRRALAGVRVGIRHPTRITRTRRVAYGRCHSVERLGGRGSGTARGVPQSFVDFRRVFLRADRGAHSNAYLRRAQPIGARLLLQNS